MSTVIRTEKLGRKLQGEVPVTLLEDVSLEIHSGEFVIITGPSGSGKSSLLYLLGLLDTPTSGKIWLNGVDTESYTDEDRAKVRLGNLGYVFQFHFLLPEFSAMENVLLPMQRLGKLSPPAMRKRAEELLGSLGLGDHLDKRPRQLSGGQSQRVAIARSLANDPSIILSDEPTGNLDTASSNTVKEILRTLAAERNKAVITVTHDTNFARDSDRLLTIIDGKLAH